MYQLVFVFKNLRVFNHFWRKPVSKIDIVLVEVLAVIVVVEVKKKMLH